ncbi:MAG: small-conductance mechanosensitive channel [Saprospiraceae bacterium]|nr:small-conductance mechanosensitive channel [Saprospiraceae bacterium]
MKRYWLLLISFVLTLVLPSIGSYFKFGGPPPGFGDFPAQEVELPPGFNQTYFIIACCISGAMLLFLVFPVWFGFRRVDAQSKSKLSDYPKWFFPGLLVMIVSWFFMWGRFEIVQPIDHYTFVPLWWGFILVLDGIVYKRNAGKSLIAMRPNTMKILAASSSFSWFVFEYLNFFVLENWYYPNSKIFTNFGNISWQLASYTTVLPVIFEFYYLLKTFPSVNQRYANGPKIRVSILGLWILWILGLISMMAMGYFPYYMFFMLWVSLIPILVPAMHLGGYWTPFMDITKKGDWSSLILIALATLCTGFFWEFWNFGSEWFHDYAPTNPNYWKYSVPFLDKYHIFSEMPILGYFGYLWFGIVCWVLWLVIAYLMNFNPSVDIDQHE